MIGKILFIPEIIPKNNRLISCIRKIKNVQGHISKPSKRPPATHSGITRSTCQRIAEPII